MYLAFNPFLKVRFASFLHFLVCTILCLASCVLRLSAQAPYDTIGKASFYAKEFNGRQTANGEIFSNAKYTCAHPTLPFGTKLKVTNLSNKKWCVVRVNDRGPYAKGRIIDLSKKAANDLGFIHQGVATVLVEEIIDENECRLIHDHDTIVAKKFPQDWKGNWCGILEMFNSRGKTMQVSMQLNIQPTLDSLRWNWIIVYDTSARNYELVINNDTTHRMYSIDEKNGIVIPATLMGNTLISTFDVQGNKIDALYTLDNDHIQVTILSVTSKTVMQTGLGTNDSPKVDAFIPNAYQTATLRRRN